MWQQIKTAPSDGTVVVLLTQHGRVLRAMWASIHGDIFGWVAREEGQHPDCWLGGVCWERNEDYEESDPPIMWCRLPTAEEMATTNRTNRTDAWDDTANA